MSSWRLRAVGLGGAVVALSGAACGGKTSSGGDDAASVLQKNNHATRDGHYVQPALTRAAAGTLTLDAGFKPTITGNVYAQPLFVAAGPGGRGVFIVVTADNNVHAVAETDGAAVWTRNLGTAAKVSGAGCGNVLPIGITGTPVIDRSTRTIYLVAAIGSDTGIDRYEIHALSIDDGGERARFPFDPASVKYGGQSFVANLHNQRGALGLLGGTLYVPFGGHAGDCGDYRGWVIGLPLGNPAGAQAFVTGARGGGIWAVGGVASDGRDVFAATGNTFGTATWARGEAVVRLRCGVAFTQQPADYFTPSDWKGLDDADLDLGGTGPLVVDVPGATPSALVVALGKNGVAYLLDRNNLGGVGKGNGMTGEGVVSAQVASSSIIDAPASYTTASGTYVVLRAIRPGSAANCPAGQSGELVAFKIGAASQPTVTVAWCADRKSVV